MNKNSLIISLAFLTSFQVSAQNQITVSTNIRPVGQSLLTGEAVNAKEYTFQERIHDFQIDRATNDILVQLRGLSKGKWLKSRGDVVRYDIDQNKVLWTKNILYERESIKQFGGVTFHSTSDKSYCLDNETAKQLWEVKNSLKFANPIDHIGIGYRLQPSYGKQNILEGIDLTTGQSIWEREISREYSWNDSFYLNDSTILVGAAGLHTINIFDGTGWDYKTITGKKDYTASAIGTGLGIATGLLSGRYSFSSGHNLVRDVVSNIISDSLYIFHASKEHIVKLDKQGQIIWQKALPSDLTSKSWIFISGDDLIMVNSGYAYMGYRQLDFGTPFIASFDIHSGDQNYLLTVSNKKKEIIKGLDLIDGVLLFVYEDHVSKYLISDGQQIIDRRFDIKEHGELNYFLDDQVFVEQDSLFLSLPKMDSTKNYLYTNKGTVLILNSNLEIENKIESDDFYIHYLNRNGKKFIAKGNKTYIVDVKGKKIAEFSASSKSTFLNGKLYDTQENRFLEIDLNDILNESDTPTD